MRVRHLLLIAVLGLVALTGCGTAHTARPLGKGNTALNVSFGGPIAEVGGATIPVPMPTIGVKHGISERNDLFAEWQVLPVAMGVGAINLGGSWYFLEQNKARPGMSATASLITTFSKDDVWAAVDTQWIVSWKLHPRHLLYLGTHLMLTPAPSEYVQNSPLHLAPLLGGEVRLGKRQRFGLGLEIKWADPWKDTENMVVNYLGSQGSLCISGGFNFYLGDGSERRAKKQQGGTP